MEAIYRIDAPGTCKICIDRLGADGVHGRAYWQGGGAPITFTEVASAVIELDSRMKYPQASTQSRSFGKRREPAAEQGGIEMDNKPLAEAVGEKATFVVQVQYRQNATWQGRVVWAEKNEAKQFRSALELIKMIDSALDETKQ